eukprot:6040057-Heterocapsa_arctica.AAC.1
MFSAPPRAGTSPRETMRGTKETSSPCPSRTVPGLNGHAGKRKTSRNPRRRERRTQLPCQ